MKTQDSAGYSGNNPVMRLMLWCNDSIRNMGNDPGIEEVLIGWIWFCPSILFLIFRR